MYLTLALGLSSAAFAIVTNVVLLCALPVWIFVCMYGLYVYTLCLVLCCYGARGSPWILYRVLSVAPDIWLIAGVHFVRVST